MTYSIKVYLKGGEKVQDGGFSFKKIKSIVKDLKSKNEVFIVMEERKNNELVEVTI